MPEKNQHNNGNCFDKNGNHFLRNPLYKNGKLVHCVAVLQRPPYSEYVHCYIENDGMAIDKSNGNDLNIPLAVYQAVGQIKPELCVKYTQDESVKMILEHKHWGSWDAIFETYYTD